jgi:hypothetical protein
VIVVSKITAWNRTNHGAPVEGAVSGMAGERTFGKPLGNPSRADIGENVESYSR